MGFSIIGTIIASLILLPNIIFYTIFPPKNIPVNLYEPAIIFDVLEKIGQFGCIVALVISKDNFKEINLDIWAVLMGFSIFTYLCLWIRYIAKGQDYAWLWKPFWIIPIPLAVFPICAFGFAAIWSQSIWIGGFTIILAIGHLAISWHSYRQVN